MNKHDSHGTFALPETNPGSILRDARITAKISPTRAAAKLKITKDQLQDIEAWRTASLPEGVYLKGLIKHYARLVDVNPKTLLDLLNSKSGLQGQPSDTKYVHTFKAKRYFVLSRVTVILSVLIFTGAAFGYILWQSTVFTAKPKLVVDYPINGEYTHSELVTIKGHVSQSTQVFVNGTAVLVDPGGVFISNLVLQRGPNTIEILAINNISKEAKVERVVIYEPLDEQR